jgi:hypothetical protein
MDWDALLAQKAALDTYNFGNTASQLKDALKEYVKSSGINAETSTLIETLRAEMNMKITEYDTLIKHMEENVESIKRDRNMGSKIETITNIRAKIDELNEQKKALYEDKYTSDARKEAVATAEKRVSYHQLFGGISRPIHAISVPILATLIVLFLAAGIFFMYKIIDFIPGGGAGLGATGSLALPSSITNIIKNPQRI